MEAQLDEDAIRTLVRKIVKDMKTEAGCISVGSLVSEPGRAPEISLSTLLLIMLL